MKEETINIVHFLSPPIFELEKGHHTYVLLCIKIPFFCPLILVLHVNRFTAYQYPLSLSFFIPDFFYLSRLVVS